MAIHRISEDDHESSLDDTNAPITDEVPPITADDIVRTQRRLEEGRDANTYQFGEMDLWVLTRLSPDQWRRVKENPSILICIHGQER